MSTNSNVLGTPEALFLRRNPLILVLVAFLASMVIDVGCPALAAWRSHQAVHCNPLKLETCIDD